MTNWGLGINQSLIAARLQGVYWSGNPVLFAPIRLREGSNQNIREEIMSQAELALTSTRGQGMTKDERFVIFASSTGTVFEWYDF